MTEQIIKLNFTGCPNIDISNSNFHSFSFYTVDLARNYFKRIGGIMLEVQHSNYHKNC